MSHFLIQNPTQAVAILENVANSFQPPKGKSRSHLYFSLDVKGNAITTTQKRKALSFEKISNIIQGITQDKSLNTAEKVKALRSYKVIQERFSQKKPGFFANLFNYLFGLNKKEKIFLDSNTLLLDCLIDIKNLDQKQSDIAWEKLFNDLFMKDGYYIFNNEKMKADFNQTFRFQILEFFD